MTIQQIITLRKESWCGVDYDLVHEWEDQFAFALNAELYYDTYKLRGGRILSRMPMIANLFQTNKPALKFRMLPLGNPPGDNKRNIYPIIVDFYLRSDEDLSRFYRSCDRNPVVYISSREIYEFLLMRGCPLPIRHLALSLPDKYRLVSLPPKMYDVVMLGRQNRVFMDYLEQYASAHSDFVYVYKGSDGYVDSRGERLGVLPDRASYWALLRSARVGLYATPGMDNARKDTNGFSQVTPRFLEYLAAGCHVLSRYVPNADTDYFELDIMSTRVQCYEDFSKALEAKMHAPIPIDSYTAYLNKHYTSNRINQIKNETIE